MTSWFSNWLQPRVIEPAFPEPQAVAPAAADIALPSTNRRVRLGPNFTLGELIKSRTALAHGIDNTPAPIEVNALRLLVSNVLQPTRNVLGAISVNSGFRCEELNKLVKGARNSDHLKGMAADIEPTGQITLLQLGSWIQDNCMFKQLIHEHGEWIHVSYDPADLRCEVLEAYRAVRRDGRGRVVMHDGKPVYATHYRPFQFPAE